MLKFIPRPSSQILRFVYCLLLVALCWTVLSPPASEARREISQVQNQSWITPGNDPILVIYRDARGQIVCREATKTERERIRRREGGGGSTRLIYAGASRETSTKTQRATAGATALEPSAGLRIVLHGTAQLEQNQQAKNAFIVAANRWETLISTPITVVIDVDFGPTFFGEPYDDSDILGATGSSTINGPYSDLRQRLINGASTSHESQLYNALPTTSLPIELNGNISSATSAVLTTSNARALGVVPNITDPDSRILGQGDAGIGFNSAFPFDFNPDDGIAANLTDFDSVATHEIGHALGFISNAGRRMALSPRRAIL